MEIQMGERELLIVEKAYFAKKVLDDVSETLKKYGATTAIFAFSCEGMITFYHAGQPLPMLQALAANFTMPEPRD